MSGWTAAGALGQHSDLKSFLLLLLEEGCGILTVIWGWEMVLAPFLLSQGEVYFRVTTSDVQSCSAGFLAQLADNCSAMLLLLLALALEQRQRQRKTGPKNVMGLKLSKCASNAAAAADGASGTGKVLGEGMLVLCPCQQSLWCFGYAHQMLLLLAWLCVGRPRAVRGWLGAVTVVGVFVQR